MISISHNNKKEQESGIQEFELNIPYAPLPYANPVTQLFPELLKHGKFSYDNVINYYALIMHWGFKTIIILTSILMNDYLKEIILLSCVEFWVVKNYSAKYLIGLRWYMNRNDIGDIYYLEKINKLYPQNRIGIYLYWYSEYIFILLLLGIMIYKIYCQFYSDTIILLFPIISTLINIFMYLNVMDGCEQVIYKYLEALTEYRMRRSIVCTFNLSNFPQFRLMF